MADKDTRYQRFLQNQARLDEERKKSDAALVEARHKYGDVTADYFSNSKNTDIYLDDCTSCTSLNIHVAGLLFWGIGINILFFMLYKVSVGATREEFLRKMEQDELIAAFSFIVILNFLFFILLYVSYKSVENKIQGAKYLFFYGWVGGLRHRCTSWLSAIPNFIGGLALAFSGLWFYLISVAY